MEKPPQNNENDIESLVPHVEMITDKELVEMIYQEESFPQDKRFIQSEKGEVFKYFDLEDITGINSYDKNIKLFPIVKIDNKIIGLAELEQDPNDSNNFWLKFVSVDSLYQGQRYSSLLVKKIFDFVKENNYSLKVSSYSEEGGIKLKKIIDRYIEGSGVKIVG